MNETTSVFGYCRVSGLGQARDDRDGFIRQECAIKKFCQDRGFELKQFFHEEGVSGTLDESERPAFSEMVSAILSNGVRTVIVERLDRLAREYRIQENLLIYLAGKDIDLISVDTGENITQEVKSDPMKKAVIQIQGVFFELERSLLVKKLKAARQRKRESGQRCEGILPFGEKLGEKEVVNRMMELRGQGMTPGHIAEKLNEEGAKTRMNARWHRTSVIRVLSREAERDKVAV